MIIEPDWPAPKHIKAFTTTRLGGISKSPFDSFNLALHVNDEEQTVLNNRQQLKSSIQLANTPCWLTQTHSNKVMELKDYQAQIEADASFTSEKHKVCVVMTADCLPVLLTDKQGSFVCAIHAGWKGLANGILNEAMKKINPQTDLLAWLGPAISKDYFEVGADVLDAFNKNGFDIGKHFLQTSQNKWLADLYGLATENLQRLGINAIYGGNYCTYHQQELFYSYRRDKITGRMASLIFIA